MDSPITISWGAKLEDLSGLAPLFFCIKFREVFSEVYNKWAMPTEVRLWRGQLRDFRIFILI